MVKTHWVTTQGILVENRCRHQNARSNDRSANCRTCRKPICEPDDTVTLPDDEVFHIHRRLTPIGRNFRSVAPKDKCQEKKNERISRKRWTNRYPLAISSVSCDWAADDEAAVDDDGISVMASCDVTLLLAVDAVVSLLPTNNLDSMPSTFAPFLSQ